MRDAPALEASRPVATPVKGSQPASMQSPPERMTTRVSSGAIRHKSVSEILGETPKPNAPTSGTDKTSADSSRAPSITATTPTHDAQTMLTRARDKDRSKLSTVVFAKQHPLKLLEPLKRASLTSLGLAERQRQEEQDYLLPLFAAQASSPPRSQALVSLLSTAHKTLTTANHYVNFHEQQDCLILKRIYQLQYASKWSLRQLERAPEPARQATHWDTLLDHVKWMRTDFREERKWKMTAARNLAMWCAVWVQSDADERATLQVRVRAPGTMAMKAAQDVAMSDAATATQSLSTPELEPSRADDAPSDVPDDDVPRLDLFNAVAPAALFSLPADDIAFRMDKTPASDSLLHELPLYEANKIVPDTVLGATSDSPDDAWKTPLAPLSKYAAGKLVAKVEGPPWKKSRYDYEEEDEDSSFHSRSNSAALTFGFSAMPQAVRYELPPEQNDVALFDQQHKHIRDRIHAGHAFRPPSEQAMPSQSFFESRQSSQWIWTEDDELRALVKEYSYNWSLISSTLSSRSTYTSAAERRTPWECFERWVSLEGLPADMQKTPYFRTYHARLESAQKTLLAQPQPGQQQQQQQAQQQQQQQAQQAQQAGQGQQGQGNNATTPVRRRTSQPIRVERRKNTKYLAMIDAMRKLAKKRETSIQKQQHGMSWSSPAHATQLTACTAAGLAAMRKANVEANQPRTAVHTPQDFSRMKHEREVKIQEKLQERAEAYRQSVAAQQKVNLCGAMIKRHL